MNNKGFTLVELIIAMSILSIVLTLGYKVIIGTDKVTKNQMEVFSEQQSANLVNRYLTKDLEQVREFTPADTSLNPYTYILKENPESMERIEYEVEKTEDGKFYTLTRKTSSGSIELLSNYPTSSEVPFSISKVKDSDNIFKVILNGKGKDFEVGKYEFEVVSRLENVVDNEDTIVPPQDGTGDKDDNDDKDDKDDNDQSGSNTQQVLNGRIDFKFSDGNGGKNRFNIEVETKAFFSSSISDNIDEQTETDKQNNISKTDDNKYIIKAKIPIKYKSDLGIFVTNCSWNESTSFINKKKLKDMLNKNLINEGIQIYAGKGIDINSVKVDNTDIVYDTINKKYYHAISNDTTKEYVTVAIEVIVNDYENQSDLTILFGKYNNDLIVN